MPQIDLFYDYRSPFAYFAAQRTSLFTDLGADISWQPVSINALINLQVDRAPTADVLDPLCPAKRAHFMADIFRLIEFWKIPFAPPAPTPPVCETAMAISALLESKGIKHAAFRNCIFEAVWQQQRDVENMEVLRNCLEESDLEIELNEQSIREGKDILVKKTELAYSQGIFGVPTFVCEGELYFGADRMELLSSRLL